MTPKQARFVAEYLKDLNGKQAAIRAGYRPSRAEGTASELLANRKVSEAVAAAQAEQVSACKLTAADTLEAIRRQVVGDIRQLFDADGNPRPITDLSAEDAALIAGFEVVIKNAAAGDGHTDRVLKIKLKDQSRYVEMAAKYFALLTDRVRLDNVDDLLSLLDAGRRRNAQR